MASMNWVFGFIQTLFGYGVLKGPSLWVQIFSAVVMLGLLIFYCYLVLHFAKNDPSRLQTEGYNLEIQAINSLYNSMTGEKSRLSISPQKQPTIQKPGPH